MAQGMANEHFAATMVEAANTRHEAGTVNTRFGKSLAANAAAKVDGVKLNLVGDDELSASIVVLIDLVEAATHDATFDGKSIQGCAFAKTFFRTILNRYIPALDQPFFMDSIRAEYGKIADVNGHAKTALEKKFGENHKFATRMILIDVAILRMVLESLALSLNSNDDKLHNNVDIHPQYFLSIFASYKFYGLMLLKAGNVDGVLGFYKPFLNKMPYYVMGNYDEYFKSSAYSQSIVTNLVQSEWGTTPDAFKAEYYKTLAEMKAGKFLNNPEGKREFTWHPPFSPAAAAPATNTVKVQPTIDNNNNNNNNNRNGSNNNSNNNNNGGAMNSNATIQNNNASPNNNNNNQNVTMAGGGFIPKQTSKKRAAEWKNQQHNGQYEEVYHSYDNNLGNQHQSRGGRGGGRGGRGGGNYEHQQHPQSYNNNAFHNAPPPAYSQRGGGGFNNSNGRGRGFGGAQNNQGSRKFGRGRGF